jgi:hypothetical protein
MDISKFNYDSNEIKQMGGAKTVRKVTIRNGKGYKSVIKYKNGKKVGTSKKPINKSHIELIKIGKFIPGLFSDCKCNKSKNKTRKI